MVLTDEQQTDAYPVASMETAQAAVENTYYSKIEETRSAKPPGYPDDTYTNPNDFVSKLNGDGNKIGTGIVLKVMSGDAVNIRATSWYKLNGASPGTPVNPLNDLVVAMSRGISAVATDYGKITITELQSNGVLTPGIGSLLSQQDASYTENTRPKAYLNWILLDEQFKLVGSSSGFEQVGDDNEFKTWVKTGLPINRNGYLYVYTSNESPVDVFFDNLQVTHVRGPLQEETHYYPFGLTMAGISSKAAGKLENRFKYNEGSELQHQEFSDGSGLELYDTHFRQLDPQIGRWWQVDPKPNYDESPFASMGNNPILRNDILGDTIVDANNRSIGISFNKKGGIGFGKNVTDDVREIATGMSQTETGVNMLKTMASSKTRISIDIDRENIVAASDGNIKGGVTDPTISQNTINGKPIGQPYISKAKITIYEAGIKRMAEDNGGKISIGGKNVDMKNTSLSDIMASFGVHEGTHATDKKSSSSLNPKASKIETEQKPYENQVKFLNELENKKNKPQQ